MEAEDLAEDGEEADSTPKKLGCVTAAEDQDDPQILMTLVQRIGAARARH